jgi:hypothetical protein
MKTTVSKSNFHDAFRRLNRSENFSYEALELLFEYFEEYEESCGTEIELDVIAICCEYTEDDIEDIKSAYDIPEDEDEDCVIEFLTNNTQYVGKTDCGLVYASF